MARILGWARSGTAVGRLSGKVWSMTALGVVIVTFNASDVILDCLESLLNAEPVDMRIVVVDNASTDNTQALIEDWAAGRVSYEVPGDAPFALSPAPKPISIVSDAANCPPAPQITLIQSGLNGGFAGGVNIGLAALAKVPEVSRFWVLNPDCMVAPETPALFANYEAGDFSLLGGRVIYLEEKARIQMDGGLVNNRTGVTGNANLGAPVDTPPADPSSFKFISGASMVASRAFYEDAGPMKEDYFLYYEEVDWAYRRGDRPLAYCPEAVVHHRAGTSIGSPTLDRIASPFSHYFKHRGRLRFLRRHRPQAIPTAWLYSLAKAAQLILKRHPKEAIALLKGAWDGAPPAEVKNRLAPEAQAVAFAPFEK